MKYSYIIIEDEKAAYQNLLTAMSPYSNYIYKGLATTVKDGIKLIYQSKPDLIFLDIQLNDVLHM